MQLALDPQVPLARDGRVKDSRPAGGIETDAPASQGDWTLDPTEAAIWRALSRRVGRAFAVQVAALAREVELTPRVTQDVVKRLREQHGMPILSGAGKPPGYYVAETLDELEACIREQRRKAISTIVMLRALRRHRARLAGQQDLGGLGALAVQ